MFSSRISGGAISSLSLCDLPTLKFSARLFFIIYENLGKAGGFGP